MENNYAGESLAKKVARVRLYKRVRQALRWGYEQNADLRVFILPGPEFAEYGALKHILKPKVLVGVDRDPVACQLMKDKWPGSITYCGELTVKQTQKAPRTWTEVTSVFGWNSFHFVHLDLMGNYFPKLDVLYDLWSRFVIPKGILATTYLRGREVKKTHEWSSMHERDSFSAPIYSTKRKCLEHILKPDRIRALQHLNSINCGYHGFLFDMKAVDRGMMNSGKRLE